MGFIVDSVAALIKLGMDLGGRRKSYMRWRMSDEGRKYFDRKEENEFWQALGDGDTTVIDTGIKEKQDRIRRLKRELGMGIVLLCLLSFGCTTYSIPEYRPRLNPGSLKSGEKTYVIEDMEIETPAGEHKTLNGQWHVVSHDFMVDFVSNQDDLIQALEALKKQRLWRNVERGAYAITLFVIAVLGLLGTLRSRRIKASIFTPRLH